MEASKFKNMVVLKNLPSNLVEEAIVILKSSKKVKDLEKIDKNKNIENVHEKKIQKNYVLKEAEMLIANYISKLENDNNQKEIIKENKRYINLKRYAYISTFIIFVQIIMLLTK